VNRIGVARFVAMWHLGPMRILLAAILACGVGTAGAGVTTTSTTPGGSTTTTTLPGGCDDDQSFDSILCRLDALIDATDASDDLGGQQAKLLSAANGARKLIRRARDKCAADGAQAEKKSGRDLRKAGRKLIGYKRGLTSNHARKQLDDSVREAFLDLVEPIADDVKALKGSVVCPPPASPSGAFVAMG
jgi:hypothetical protein